MSTICIDWQWVAIGIMFLWLCRHDLVFYILGKQSTKLGEMIEETERWLDEVKASAGKR